MEWQPIETAPKDLTEILVCQAGTGNIEFCRYSEFCHEWLDRTADDFTNATHWMPIPAIP